MPSDEIRTTDATVCAECGLPFRSVERRIWSDGSQRHLDCDTNKDAEIKRLRAHLAQVSCVARAYGAKNEELQYVP